MLLHFGQGMSMFWKVFEKFKAFGMFVASVVNYLLLLIVYIIGVGMTWLGVRIAGKQLLEYGSKTTLWQEMKTDHSLERAKRMF